MSARSTCGAGSHRQTTARDLRYRADIDGLRAVSILLVVGYHGWPSLWSGGFVGVDIFFVMSGFLITGIILAQMKAGTFSAVDFYGRRVRRIFPALLLMLLATYLVGWFILLPDEFMVLGQGIAAGAGFVSNLFQLRHVGYFAPDAADNPLLHLWSLGIEEQFYILWPLILLTLPGSGRRPWAIGAMALASFGISLAIYDGYQASSFYSPIPRAWELLAGALLALRNLDRAGVAQQIDAADEAWHDARAILGIGLIAVAAFGLNKTVPYPGVAALLPVSGAVLLLMSPRAWLNRKVLSHRAMVAVGLISYPLYLWHWPLLSYLNVTRNDNPNASEVWLVVGIAFAMAWATYRFVEIPVRRARHAVPALASGLAFAGLIGLGTIAAAGFSFRFPADIRDIAMLPPDANSGFHTPCFLKGYEDPSRLGDACIEDGIAPLLLLWGDSTAAALYPGLQALQATRPLRLAQFTSEGCPPMPQATAPEIRPACAGINARVLDFVARLTPDIVLLHAMWESYSDLAQLRETIAQLKQRKVRRIVVLGPVPVWKRGLPHALVNAYRFGHVIPARIMPGGLPFPSDETLKSLSAADAVDYISAVEALCTADGCIARLGPSAADVIATDKVHVSDRGSQFLIGAIADQLLPR